MRLQRGDDGIERDLVSLAGGAQLALDDNNTTGKFLNQRFSLEDVRLDDDGDAAAAALRDLERRGIRPKYIYTIPTVQNPTGTILSEQRRHELLRLSQDHNVPIFEDDCYADLIWDGRRPPARR